MRYLEPLKSHPIHSVSSGSQPFRIRPWHPGDAPGVREVLEASYGQAATPASVYDWWSFGPHKHPGGFMVAEAEGRVVGVQPMGFHAYNDGSRSLKGGLLTGVAVHPEFRRLGIFTALIKACEAEAWRQGADFVTTMPNEKSRPGFLKLGYTDLGRRSLLLRPLRASALGGRFIPVMGHLGGAGFACLQALLKPERTTAAVQTQEVTTLPEDLPELENRHAELYPALRLHRTPVWWRWRYLDCPLSRYRFFEARSPDRRLLGFAVTTTEVRQGITLSYLMDLAVSDRSVLGSLLVRIFACARSAGAHAMAVVGSSPPLLRDLARQGFWFVPQWAPVKRFYSVARFAPATSPPASWRQITGWYQMLGDWDNL